MQDISKRLCTVLLLLLLLVPGVAASSGDGDIPETRPVPVLDGSGQIIAVFETDLDGPDLWDYVRIFVQTYFSALP